MCDLFPSIFELFLPETNVVVGPVVKSFIDLVTWNKIYVTLSHTFIMTACWIHKRQIKKNNNNIWKMAPG